MTGGERTPAARSEGAGKDGGVRGASLVTRRGRRDRRLDSRAGSPCHKGSYRSGDLYHCSAFLYVCKVAEIMLLTEWFFLR